MVLQDQPNQDITMASGSTWIQMISNQPFSSRWSVTNIFKLNLRIWEIIKREIASSNWDIMEKPLSCGTFNKTAGTFKSITTVKDWRWWSSIVISIEEPSYWGFQDSLGRSKKCRCLLAIIKSLLSKKEEKVASPFRSVGKQDKNTRSKMVLASCQMVSRRRNLMVNLIVHLIPSTRRSFRLITPRTMIKVMVLICYRRNCATNSSLSNKTVSASLSAVLED